MHFPADTQVQSEILTDAEVVLKLEIEFFQADVVEGSVAVLRVVAGGAEKEIRIEIAGIRARQRIGAGGGVIDCSGEVTELDLVG